MKVLLANSEPGFRGGESQTLALAKGLAAAGCDVTIAARDGSALAARAGDEGAACRSFAFEKVPLSTPWDLARFISSLRPDIVHAQTADAHTHLWIACRLMRRPPPLVVSRRVAFRVRRTPFNVLKYRTGVAHFIPISRAAAASLAAAGVPDARMTIVPSGVDTARFAALVRPGEPTPGTFVPPGRFTFGTVGALEREKGHATLLAASATVVRERPGAYVVIAGEGSLARALQSQIVDLRLEFSADLVPEQPPIEKVLCRLDLFVLPSLEEGLSTALIAAMASGLAVVASDTGGIPDVVTPECGILVPPGDPEALARAILGLARDPATREAMGRAAAARAREFDISKTVERTLFIYRHVLCSNEGG